MEANQLLRDPQMEPTAAVIANALGDATAAYTSFLEKLAAHGVTPHWQYYRDGSAWLAKGLYRWTTTRGTAKEITAFWLSIWDGFFKVTIFIPEKHRTEAVTLPLSTEIRSMIESAQQMGKLTFFPVLFDLCSTELFDGLFTLIDFKITLK